MSIGQNIKRLRESRDLTQGNLAKIVGVSDKAVSTWENDIKVPRMGVVQKLSEYFGVPKSVIIDGNTDINAIIESLNPSEEDIKIALFGGDGEATDEMWEEAKNYALYIKEREQKRREGK